MSLSTPAAIVLGLTIAGALAGLGLYLGMREIARARGDAVSAATTTSATPDAPRVPSPAPRAEGEITSDAARAIESHREELRARCWAPSAAKAPTPPKTTVTLTIAFDPTGSQFMRGYEDDPDAPRPDVTMCVAQTLPQLHVPPTGRVVRVVVPLTLP